MGCDGPLLKKPVLSDRGQNKTGFESITFIKKNSVHRYMTDQPYYDGLIKGRPDF
jgi:hypothetical protein